MVTENSTRQMLLHRIEAYRDRVIELCSRLAATDSQNPPGDTTRIADVCMAFLRDVPGIDAQLVVGRAPMANVLARVKGARPGRRLVFNGHLDTGTVPDPDRWTVPPFGGVVRDGRIYGRGVADMKAGVAAQLAALAVLAEFRSELSGEAVLTLVADEGTGAQWGTLHLLDKFAEARGDAMISGDVGSPLVARFGEKGFLWLDVAAEGKPAGGAHTYLGINAVNRLMDALGHVQALENCECAVPPDIAKAIDAAAAISEGMHGRGETNALKRVTVNIGVIEGGRRINAVPSAAHAHVDIRFPAGVTADDLLAQLKAKLANAAGITVTVLDKAEPNWTDPGSEIARLIQKNGKEASGREPVLSMRLGFSDARHYRERGIPSIGFGAAAHNGNAPDEFVEVNDLLVLVRTYVLTAHDFLTRPGT